MQPVDGSLGIVPTGEDTYGLLSVLYESGSASMVEMSLEIPVKLLNEILPTTDLGFSLAHMILKDSNYARAYRNTTHLLDNSMYELNEPLSLDELLSAVEQSSPEAVIGPDWESNQVRTSEVSTLLQQRMRKPVTTGIVIHGSDRLNARAFFHYAQARSFRPICFPFRIRELRYYLLLYLEQHHDFKSHEWYHLLGMNTPDELKLITRLPGRWSFDTAKACKPGLDMATDKWSGHPRLDLYRKYSRSEIELVHTNIAYLRSIYA